MMDAFRVELNRQRRWASAARMTTEKAHTKHERLKHVTNDSRLDLSFIIVSDTCRRHRPLFCHLHNNNRLWHVSEPDSCASADCIAQEQIKGGKFCGLQSGTKKSHISWRHKHVFNISACKHDKLRFNQLWKCVQLVVVVVAVLVSPPSTSTSMQETNNFPIKTFLSSQQIKLQIESNNIVFSTMR